MDEETSKRPSGGAIPCANIRRSARVASEAVPLSILSRLVRRASRLRRGWSTTRDREYHEALFAGPAHDPFSDAYPGRLTIRRFADLAAPHVPAGAVALDLGCGPGEITCELARRFPGTRFLGVDHSANAIARATALARANGLANVLFETGDLERYAADGPVGLVMLFDAFHHLLDPAAFVDRLGRVTDRFFLIEPAGTRLGQWQRGLDLDWLAASIFEMRDRLEEQFGLSPALPTPAAAAPSDDTPEGEPTEFRYGMHDFLRLFEGFGVDVRGTVAGLETYGSTPDAGGPLREDVGRFAYTLVVEVDELMRRHDLDLAAKHWAIYAERGARFPPRTVPSLQGRHPERLQAGPYDVEYGGFDGPSRMRCGAVAEGALTITNRSWRVWDSADADGPVFVSYRWLDSAGVQTPDEGLRSTLPRPVGPGDSCAAAIRIQAPARPGRYTLAIDLVREHVTWFSEAGAPPLRLAIAVER